MPGEAAPYRERTAVFRGHVRSYKAKSTATWQARIYSAADKNPPPVYEGALALTAEFRMPRTKSLPKRKEIAHTVKPDVDNCLKALMDGLSPWIPRDQVVVDAHVTKRYALPGETPGCQVSLREVEGE